jgi:hypothetical protein
LANPPGRCRRGVVHSNAQRQRLSREGGIRTSGIFISYRREDAPAHAGRLYDALADEFGSERVFMDVDTLEPGVDFVERINSAVGAADALLVVVGRGWLNAKNLDGERRLDDPKDFVRLEVGTALSGDPVVIPVLVGGATMPQEDQLPEDLALLARRNAVTLSDADWRAGMGRLVAALRRIVDPVEEPQRQPLPVVEEVAPLPPVEASPEPRVPALASALGFAGIVLLVIGTWMQLDLWAHPNAGAGDRDGLGFFTSAAPMTVLLGAALNFLFSYSRGRGRLCTGLFLGFALSGVARYVGWLGIASDTTGEEASRNVGGAWSALLGCTLLAVAAGVRIAADRDVDAGRPGTWARALVVAGAVLVVVGTILPFNDGPVPTRNDSGAVIDRDGGWWAFEPIAAAAFAVAAAFVLGRRRSVAGGVMIAIGTFLSVLWAARYIGFPAWQPDDISSIGTGGIVGLAGGLVILVAGLLARPSAASGRIPSGRPVEEVS